MMSVKPRSWLDLWDDHKRIRGQRRSDRTIAEWDRTRALLYQRLGPARLTNVSISGAEDFAAWLHGRGLSDASVHKHISTARTVWSWGMRTERCENNPWLAVETSRPRTESMEYVDAADVERIIDSADMPTACLFGLCRYAGLRSGEAYRLKWGDIDFQRQRLTVHPPGGVETNKHRYRQVPVSIRLAKLLRDGFEEAVDGSYGPCDGAARNHTVLTRVVRTAGVRPYKKPLHSLRASCGSDWAADWPAAQVCLWMGHSATVAAKHYQKPIESLMDEAAGSDLSARLRSATSSLQSTDVERVIRYAESISSNGDGVESGVSVCNSNSLPSGYEPDELPDCSTPQSWWPIIVALLVDCRN